MDHLYIDTPEALAELCSELRREEWLALDTEFLREQSYRPRLCLIQVANSHVIACVDPLALDIEPLLDVLYEPGITKVLHAAGQDLEIFTTLCGTPPAPIFDTQIAATVLGQGEQVGYGALVQTVLGLQLEKTQARTDWCRRPLNEEQLNYAADDVRHLREVFHAQRRQLQELGRDEWLTEDFAELSNPARYTVEPEKAWRKVKGASRLKPAQLAVLQQLAAWREQRAVQLDKPRRWILKDDPLLDLARQQPKTQDKMSHIRGLDAGLLKRSGNELLDLIEKAQATPREAWPSLPKGPRLSPAQEPLVDLGMALLRERCREQNISPGAVGSRKEIEALLHGEDSELPLLHGWRRAVAGETLQRLFAGELSLSVAEGGLQYTA